MLAATVVACGGGREQPTEAPPRPAPRVTAPVQPPIEDELRYEVPAGTRSIELVRTIGVRLQPGDDAKRIGTIAVDTRVRWGAAATGKGCQGLWVELAPRGWICTDYVRASTKPPLGREVPILERGELVPGVYGKVTAPSSVIYELVRASDGKTDGKGASPGTKPSDRGSADEAPVTSPRELPDAPVTGAMASTASASAIKVVAGKMVEGRPLVGSINVRQWDEIVVAGKAYWRVAQKDNEYVLRSAISQHRPSTFRGSRLGDDTGWTLPIAFVWPRAYQSTYTMHTAKGGGVNRQIAAKTAIAILETATDAAGKPTAYRIGDAEWIRAADVRVFPHAPPPPHLEPHERWIDIDLDTQILVAFEGETAVYATLVSSGTKDTPTETGVYRMWLKESEADMKGLSGESPYSVATVPWTQFFFPEKGLAVHTAYWHDQFGTKKSHGCVNLAPRDARWLYFWSDPVVPPGWTMTAGVVEAPGSIVRVRSKDDPNPPFKGYAKTVQNLRERGS